MLLEKRSIYPRGVPEMIGATLSAGPYRLGLQFYRIVECCF